MFILGVSLAFVAHADLIIKSPTDGSTVKPDPKLGRVVVVQFEGKNFKIEDFTKVTAINGHEGHIHIQMDNNPCNTHVASTVYVFGNVEPGPQTLTLELVHNNHAPLKKPVKKTVHFTME